MFPYLVAFVISIVATYLSANSSGRGFTKFLYTLFAVAPLVILAAFRAHTIGTDTPNYVALFRDAVQEGGGIVRYIYLHPSFEFGFLAYNYIIAQFVKTMEVYYLITYGLIVGFTYASAMRLKDYLSPTVFMTVYYFLYFSDTLNVMRQYIAIAFVFYAIANLFTDRTKTYIAFTILASLFHASAVLSFLIGILYFIVKRFPLSENKVIYAAFGFMAFLAIMKMDAFAHMNLIPVFESKLQNHLNNALDGGVSNSHIMVCFCTLVFIFYSHAKGNAACDLFLLMLILTLIFYLSPSMNATLYRFTLYFNTLTCFAVSYVYKGSAKKTKNRYFVLALLSLYVFFYFFSIVISKTNDVIPYEFIVY